jgi:hypothetical protein
MPNKLSALLVAYDYEVARATYTPAVPNALVRHDEPIPEKAPTATPNENAWKTPPLNHSQDKCCG